jgi:hypothetical protein
MGVTNLLSEAVKVKFWRTFTRFLPGAARKGVSVRIVLFRSSDLARIVPLVAAACAFMLQAQTPVTVDNPEPSLSSNSSAGSALQQTKPPASSSVSSPWNQLLLDGFQLGMRSMGSQQGGTGGGMGMNGGGLNSTGSFQPSAGAQGFGPGAQAAGGARGGGAPDLASLFQLASDLSRGLGAGRNGGLGTALGVLPKLNQLMRSGLNFNLGSNGFGSQGGPGVGGGPGGGMGMGGGGFSPTGSASFGAPRGRMGRFDFSASASVSAPGVFMGNSSAGMSSFGRGSGGSGAAAGSWNSMQSGSMGGAPHGGAPGGMGQGGSGGGQNLPSANVSLHLSF